jgi:hypothetical protein
MFMCEAGCGPSESIKKKEFPGYVVDKAPKNDWPAFCFFYTDDDSSRKASAEGTVQHYSCSASAKHVKRVCPCQSAPGLGTQAGQLDALQSNHQQIIGKPNQDRGGGGGSVKGNVEQSSGDQDLNAENNDDDRDKYEQQFALDDQLEDLGEDQRRRQR